MAQYLAPGTILKDSYVIEEALGAGGYGVTYRARHTALDKLVCIKELFLTDYCTRDDDGSVTCPTENIAQLFSECRSKFIKEAQTLASFNFTNIVPVSDVFSANGTEYYVMAYLPGGSLQQMVRQHGALSCSDARRYTRQIASALSQLHSRQMCHFDVKPGNVMLDASGIAVLIDFGITKHYDGHGNQTSATPVGVSAGYAPLEQYQGGTDRFSPESDIYSLGATLYFLATGNVPPEAAKVLDQGLPPLPPHLDSGIVAAITAAMQPRRADRPQSIAEFVNILGTDASIPERIAPVYGPPSIDETTLGYTTDSSTDDDIEPEPRRKIWPIIAVIALLIGAGGALLYYFAQPSENSEIIAEEQAVGEPQPDARSVPPVEEPADTASAVPDEPIDTTPYIGTSGEDPDYWQEESPEQQAAPSESSTPEPAKPEPKPAPANDSEIFKTVDQMPQFPGGDPALIRFISAHIQYPVIAQENNIQGRVIVQFVVTKTGSIGDVKVVKSVDPSLDNEAKRLVKMLPKFIPGKLNGQPVNVWYTTPINFRLQ